MMKKSNKKGFTLVELIVVIAIMAILAAVLVPVVTNKIDDANKSSAVSEMGTIASAINAAYMSNQASQTPVTKYADLQTKQPEIADYTIGKPAAFKHGKYQVKIEFVAKAGDVEAHIKVSVVAGNDDAVVDNQTKTVTLPEYTA